MRGEGESGCCDRVARDRGETAEATAAEKASGRTPHVPATAPPSVSGVER